MRVIYSGRRSGKMYSLKEFLDLLPEDIRKKVAIVEAKAPPKLKGNKRISRV